jgi:hypothetical protein
VKDKGFEPTTDAASADIDVWGYAPGEPKPVSKYGVQHFSLKYNGVWTSKLGDWYLVVHDREALAGTVGHAYVENGQIVRVKQAGYGKVIKHYKKTTTAHSLAIKMSTNQDEVPTEDIALVQEQAKLASSVPMLIAKNPIPAKTATPKTSLPRPTSPKPSPSKPTPPKTTPPKQTPPSTGGVAAFDKAYAAYKTTWSQPALEASSK